MSRYALPFFAASLGLLIAFPALAKPARQSLVVLSVEGYDAYKDIRSLLDIGVVASGESDALTCAIADPKPGTKAAGRPWAPFDFYTNVLTQEEMDQEEAAGRLGEADIFFDGDNHNRNRGKHSHRWTRQVTDAFKGSLDFLQKKTDKDSFSFLLQFTRGKITYGGLVRARTYPKDGQCVAETVLCTKTYEADGKTHCHPDAWTKRVTDIVAEASVSGALSDKLWRVTDEKLKTDVASVSVVFQDLDKDGDDLGKPYKEKVAPK